MSVEIRSILAGGLHTFKAAPWVNEEVGLYVINLAGDVDHADDLAYVERNHSSSSKLSFIKCTRWGIPEI
jgi:hypothetical protein